MSHYEKCTWTIRQSKPGAITIRTECGSDLFFNRYPDIVVCPICKKNTRILSVLQNPYKKINPYFLTNEGFLDQWTAFLLTLKNESNLSWKAMANQAGIQYTALYSWSAQRVMPSGLSMLKMLDAFDANIYEIFCDDDTDTLKEVSDDI